jgi:hypothetical protein
VAPEVVQQPLFVLAVLDLIQRPRRGPRRLLVFDAELLLQRDDRRLDLHCPAFML